MKFTTEPSMEGAKIKLSNSDKFWKSRIVISAFGKQHDVLLRMKAESENAIIPDQNQMKYLVDIIKNAEQYITKYFDPSNEQGNIWLSIFAEAINEDRNNLRAVWADVRKNIVIKSIGNALEEEFNKHIDLDIKIEGPYDSDLFLLFVNGKLDLDWQGR